MLRCVEPIGPSRELFAPSVEARTRTLTRGRETPATPHRHPIAGNRRCVGLQRRLVIPHTDKCTYADGFDMPLTSVRGGPTGRSRDQGLARGQDHVVSSCQPGHARTSTALLHSDQPAHAYRRRPAGLFGHGDDAGRVSGRTSVLREASGSRIGPDAEPGSPLPCAGRSALRSRLGGPSRWRAAPNTCCLEQQRGYVIGHGECRRCRCAR